MYAHERRQLVRFGRLCDREFHQRWIRRDEEEIMESEDEEKKEAEEEPINWAIKGSDTLPELFYYMSFSKSCSCYDYEVSGDCWCPDYIN